jgi:hypothetical protein
MEVWQQAVRIASNHANQMRDYGQIGVYEDATPKGDGWVGSWPIGSGTFGKTYRYIRQNDSGQLCNRIVVKDAVYNYGLYEINLWENVEKWFWMTDRHNRKILVEVKAMSDLRGRVGAEYAVRILNWRVASDLRLYRLYLEVRWHNPTCPHQRLTVSQYVEFPSLTR